MRSLHVLELLHVLGFLTNLGGADGFVFRAASTKPGVLSLGAARTNDGNGVSSKSGGAKARDLAVASRHSRSPPAQPLQQACCTPWLADIMASWFNLPLPNTSRAGGTKRRSTHDDIRADILKLRVSNAELREEVLALRNSMAQRGFFPVDDVFATATATGGTSASGNGQQPPTSEGGDPKPPAKLQREARLAALVVLWGAAVAIGGVFVPIAIGVGAARSLRWLDDGGTLVPKRWRGRQLGWGWRRARALSFVPVLACPPSDGGGGGEGLVTGEALADAWDEMYPPRQR
ncbi:unnamed protein product [Ectocarpus sp. CCAP 1310/34]|nr:unnamed protein product [Ectocarpus sp. CCAP 1310/34]